jgi:hypothetical protein
MAKTQRWQLVLGLLLTGFSGAAARAATHPAEGEARFTVHVRDYAQVDAKTLAEAEQVAAGIFRKAGVEAHWVEISKESSADLTDMDTKILVNLQVHILPQEMANQLGMPDNAMGLAPGKGPDRKLVYVLYECVRKLAQRQVREQTKGDVTRNATAAQILGEMMAHELGHILLNLPSHSQIGIMRGDWDLKDLADVAYGFLFFTRQQAEIMRADVRRRGTAETARFISQPSAPK